MKYDPFNVKEDYFEYIRDDRILSETVTVDNRKFHHDYQNPPKLEDLSPGDVVIMCSQLSSAGAHLLRPLVFLGGIGMHNGVKVMGHRIPTFRYKVLGTSTIMTGIFVMKNIYVEVWP